MQKKKAISLIVLIITIIVMIILASAIIMSLDNANIFNKAEEAVDKTNAATNKYLSEIKLAERELEKIQGPSKVTDANPGTLKKEDNTYYIESIEDLVAFSELVNSGEKDFEGETVKLTRLLDFNSNNSYATQDETERTTLKTSLTTGRGFTPIGTPDAPFKGIFDGDGAEIRNIYINVPETETEDLYVAFFGVIEDSTIQNLGVTGNIYYNFGEGAACLVSGADSITKQVKILNCYNKINISVPHDAYLAAGIFGCVYAKSTFGVLIEDCYNAGNITAEAYAIGGIVGAGNNVTVNRCYNIGKIICKGQEDNYTHAQVGGLIGETNDDYIVNSYNLGQIDIYEVPEYCGGICGGRSSKVENSYNAGNIKLYADPNMTACGTGGVCGTATDIKNCYNIGKLEGEKTSEVVANMNGITFERVYFIDGKNPTDFGTATSGAPEAIELNVMKSQAFVDKLNEYTKDREDLVKWKLGSTGYPVLDY